MLNFGDIDYNCLMIIYRTISNLCTKILHYQKPFFEIVKRAPQPSQVISGAVVRRQFPEIDTGWALNCSCSRFAPSECRWILDGTIVLDAPSSLTAWPSYQLHITCLDVILYHLSDPLISRISMTYPTYINRSMDMSYIPYPSPLILPVLSPWPQQSSQGSRHSSTWRWELPLPFIEPWQGTEIQV